MEYGLVSLKASLQGCSGKVVEIEQGTEQKRESVSMNPETGHYLQKAPTRDARHFIKGQRQRVLLPFFYDT